MFWNKTKYEPKVGDKVLRWWNIMNGVEPTRTQRKPSTALLKDDVFITEITRHAYKFSGEEEYTTKERYFLEPVYKGREDVPPLEYRE